MATLNDVREQATAALNAGDHRGALSLVLLMQRHFPDDYRTLELLGKLFLEGRRLDEARTAFSRVLEIDPENVVARAALGMVSEEEGDLDAAMEQFERAFDVDPGNHEIAAEIARLHARLNHTRSPEPGSSMHSMARRFLNESKFESAIPWLQEALRTAPDLTDVAVGLTRALWLSRQSKEAEEVAREVLAEHPDCLRALAIVAASGLSRGSKKSLALLSETAKLNPGNAVARGLFADSGLVYPEHPEDLDIPDAEVLDALASSDEAPAEVPAVPVPGRPEAAVDEDASEAEASAEASEAPEPSAEVISPSPDDEASRSDLLEQSVLAADLPQPEPSEPEPANPLLRRLAVALGETPQDVATDMPATGSTSDDRPPAVLAQGEQLPGAQPELAGAQRAELTAGGVGVWEPVAEESAADHIAAARRYAEGGEVELTLAEYRAALRLDPSVAQSVGDAVLALVEGEPDNSLARWLAGDALTLNGQYRKAVEQYLLVLKRDLES